MAIYLAGQLLSTFPFIEKVSAAYPVENNTGNEVIITINVSVRRPFYSQGKWQKLVEQFTSKMLGPAATDQIRFTYKYVLNYNYN